MLQNHPTQSFSKKRKSHEHHHSRKRHHHHHHAIAGAAVLSITFDALFQQASPTVVRPGFHTLGQDVNMPNKTLSISTSNVSLDLNKHTLNANISIAPGIRNVTIRNGTLGKAISITAATWNFTLQCSIKDTVYIENANVLKLKDVKALGLKTMSSAIQVKNANKCFLENVQVANTTLTGPANRAYGRPFP